MGKVLCTGIRDKAEEHGITVRVEECGSMFTVFSAQSRQHVTRMPKKAMLNSTESFSGHAQRGNLSPPSQFEAAFISLAHTKKDIRRTIEAAEQVFQKMNKTETRTLKSKQHY